jgi:hypothetical protein
MVKCKMHFCGSSSVVERQLPKLNVAGSNPVSRSKTIVRMSTEYLCGLFYVILIFTTIVSVYKSIIKLVNTLPEKSIEKAEIAISLAINGMNFRVKEVSLKPNVINSANRNVTTCWSKGTELLRIMIRRFRRRKPGHIPLQDYSED